MGRQNTYEIALLGLILFAVMAASVLWSQEILLWFGYTVAVFLVYLLWRFVRAIEELSL
ncbi:hypothetical protein ACFQMM_08035 [Saliphagus sp. GCM10025308]